MAERNLVPEGRYDAVVSETALGVASTGTENVAIRLKIADDAFPDLAGRTLVYYGYFSDGAMDLTLDALEACGWDPGLAAFDDLGNGDCVKGNPVSIVVRHEDDQKGVRRDRVAFVNARGGGMVKDRMNDGQTAVLGKKIEALMRQRGRKVTPRAAAPAQKQAEYLNVDEDSTPF